MTVPWFTAHHDGAATCGLCPHACRLAPGKRGRCRARKNQGGKIVALTAGRVCSMALDPVEKKPLYHFHPGEQILSIGSWGCNLGCAFCQNWEISQQEAPTRELPPEALTMAARETGVRLIAHTYNEPWVNFEYVLACARAAREAGLKTALVSNGYWNLGPARELLEVTDAANLDLKAFRDDFYRELCGGSLAPVLAAIELAKRHCHVELTTLLIPGKNDAPAEIAAEAKWIAKHCGADTPLHFSAYFPRYRLDLPPTPTATLLRARDVAREHLRFVYLGNVAVAGDGDNGASTVCPACGAVAVRRQGYRTEVCGLGAGGRCAACGENLSMVTGAASA